MLERLEQLLKTLGRPFRHDPYRSVTGVAHPTGHPEPLGRGSDEVPEPDALNPPHDQSFQLLLHRLHLETHMCPKPVRSLYTEMNAMHCYRYSEYCSNNRIAVVDAMPPDPRECQTSPCRFVQSLNPLSSWPKDSTTNSTS